MLQTSRDLVTARPPGRRANINSTSYRETVMGIFRSLREASRDTTFQEQSGEALRTNASQARKALGIAV